MYDLNLVKVHVDSFVKTSIQKGTIIQHENAISLNYELLESYRIKLLENEFQNPIFVSLFGTYNSIIRLINLNLNFQTIASMEEHFSSKKDFTDSLLSYKQVLEDDYTSALEKIEPKLQKLIVIELKSLKPDVVRLKNEKLNKEIRELLRQDGSENEPIQNS